MEGFRNNPRESFEKGDVVIAKEDANPNELKDMKIELGTRYRVIQIDRHRPSDDDNVWIGPLDTEQEVLDTFSPAILLQPSLDPRYLEIRPVPSHLLKKLALH